VQPRLYGGVFLLAACDDIRPDDSDGDILAGLTAYPVIRQRVTITASTSDTSKANTICSQRGDDLFRATIHLLHIKVRLLPSPVLVAGFYY